MKIVVLAGGLSGERNVSLSSGTMVAQALRDRGHRVALADLFMGLEDYDREILTSIIKNYGGGPVGVETLAISVGESMDTLEDYYEPYLIQCGLLQRTPRGRMVTEKAYRHLGIKNTGEKSTPELFSL